MYFFVYTLEGGAWAYTCDCGSQGMLWVFSASHLIFLFVCFCLALEIGSLAGPDSPCKLDWQTSQLQGSSCLHLYPTLWLHPFPHAF